MIGQMTLSAKLSNNIPLCILTAHNFILFRFLKFFFSVLLFTVPQLESFLRSGIQLTHYFHVLVQKTYCFVLYQLLCYSTISDIVFKHILVSFCWFVCTHSIFHWLLPFWRYVWFILQLECATVYIPFNNIKWVS